MSVLQESQRHRGGLLLYFKRGRPSSVRSTRVSLAGPVSDRTGQALPPAGCMCNNLVQSYFSFSACIIPEAFPDKQKFAEIMNRMCAVAFFLRVYAAFSPLQRLPSAPGFWSCSVRIGDRGRIIHANIGGIDEYDQHWQCLWGFHGDELSSASFSTSSIASSATVSAPERTTVTMTPITSLRSGAGSRHRKIDAFET